MWDTLLEFLETLSTCDFDVNHQGNFAIIFAFWLRIPLLAMEALQSSILFFSYFSQTWFSSNTISGLNFVSLNWFPTKEFWVSVWMFEERSEKAKLGIFNRDKFYFWCWNLWATTFVLREESFEIVVLMRFFLVNFVLLCIHPPSANLLSNDEVEGVCFKMIDLSFGVWFRFDVLLVFEQLKNPEGL